jgi:NADP-dependent 3-hydroxy acid dehydrogenase YdfG
MAELISAKVVVITGASSGIGNATAGLLASQGACVVLGARRLSGLELVASEIISAGGKVAAMQTDISNSASFVALID